MIIQAPHDAPTGHQGSGFRRVWQSIEADMTAVTQVRRELTEFARQAGFSEPRLPDIALACYEAMTNIAEHAYPADLPDRASRTFDVTAAYEPTGAGAAPTLRVTFDDYGHWDSSPTDPAQHRGRGITLMRACSNSCSLVSSPEGTRVSLQWNDDPPRDLSLDPRM